jgi:hypothetical protein
MAHEADVSWEYTVSENCRACPRFATIEEFTRWLMKRAFEEADEDLTAGSIAIRCPGGSLHPSTECRFRFVCNLTANVELQDDEGNKRYTSEFRQNPFTKS